MNIEEIIKKRHSVRSYTSKEIEKEKIDILNELINDINPKENLHIQLIINDPDVFDKYGGFILQYGKLHNCKNYIALIGKKDDNLLEEKCGYNGEKLVLKATELGLNTCFVAGTYKKKYVTANISEDEELVCVIALGYGETNGNVRKSKSIEEVTDSKEYPDWFEKGIEYALLAPTALNQQKFKLNYLGDNVVEAITLTGPKSKIDIGIVKYHFELGAGREIIWK